MRKVSNTTIKDSLELQIRNLCYEIFSQSLNDNQVQILIEALISYDGLFEEFLKSPKYILKEIAASSDATNLIYIPCYTLELRHILQGNSIFAPYKIAAFNSSFAKDHLNEYNCLIVLDKTKLPAPELGLKGVYIFDTFMNIKDAIVRVYCRERGDSEGSLAAAKIVAEENPEVNFAVLTDVPGFVFPKTAQADMKKFVVNIQSLGIDEEVIKSVSPEGAVEEALKRKKHKMKIPHNDPKFTAEFWRKTEFWPYIVHQASKFAQSTDIQLNDTEQKIFKLLLDVNNKYQLGLSFRVAGGWVRDKMLGKESDDIDIAIDKMTGSQFGEYLTKEIGKSGNTIKANPDQSKHLETMTINLFGQDIDFVNLRNESYGDSRIPEMEFGTAEQDASRRDLTINSLFYNVNTAQVEDFTGKGIEDLKSMTLRTPLDPIKTFTDDPLRILRALRFYSRYKGSKLDPAMIEAMKDPNVQEALKNKVSPERVYKELTKLMSGNQQSSALRVLHETGLWDKVIKPAEMESFHPFTMDQNNPHHIDNVLEHTLKVIDEYDKILRADGAGDDERATALMAAFFHDIGKLDPSIIGIKENAEGIIQNTYHGHEDISAKMSEIIMNALKASNEEVNYIRTIIQHHMLPHNPMSDKQIRKLMRELGVDILKRVIQHAKADVLSKPGADAAHYDSLLERLKTVQPSAPNKNTPPIDRRKIMALPEYQQLIQPARIKLGWLNDLTNELQDLKDNDPTITEEQLLQYCIQVAPKYNQNPKYMVQQSVQPKQKQQPKQPPKQAQTWYETMRTTGEKPNRAEWLCGRVYMDTAGDENQPLPMLDTGLTTYELKHIDEKTEILNSLGGKSICARGLIKGLVFTISEWQEQADTKNPNQDYVKRENPEKMSNFEVGMKVRHRRRGLAFAQLTGTVEKILGNLMYVRWQGVPELEVFNLNDTVNLSMNLSKA